MKPTLIFKRIVRDYFGNNFAACGRHLGISRAATQSFGKGRRPIPPLVALDLEVVCQGEYKAEDMNPKAAALRQRLRELKIPYARSGSVRAS